MDDVRRFCIRILGDGPAARQAEDAARGAGPDDLTALTAAVAACRSADPAPPPDDALPPPSDLPAAVERELTAATARLQPRQRELLALRELLQLGYADIAAVAGVAEDDVPAALARARLELRAQLRGPGMGAGGCVERERALLAIARRQDGEPVADADDEWLIEHLGHCAGCAAAHAAALEASACYRAWRSPAGEAGATAGGDPAPAAA